MANEVQGVPLRNNEDESNGEAGVASNMVVPIGGLVDPGMVQEDQSNSQL